jgi:hypothetical protein
MDIEMRYGKPERQNISEIIDQYSSNSINSVYTSIVPLLQYWKDIDNRIIYYFKKIRINSNHVNHVKVCFEYPTPSYKSNKCSMTDLMIFCNNSKIAIEGKYTEVKRDYTTVEKWNDGTDNRKQVMLHWQNIIQPFSSKQMDISNLPYQFLHRVASACYQNNSIAYTVYQLFYDSDTIESCRQFIKVLKESKDVLKPTERLKIFVNAIEVELIDKIKKELVLQRLKENDLYNFKKEELYEL